MSSPTVDSPSLRFGASGPARTPEEDIERRKLNLERWRRRSGRVRLARVALPAAIGAVVAGLIGWTVGGALFWRLGAVDPKAGLSIRMINPHFQGRDSQNRPYIISAASAVRDDRDFQKVSLEAPVFILNPGLSDESRINALRGAYREDTRVLTLEGQVGLNDAGGNHFATERAVIDTTKNDVDGDLPVQGHGPLGRIAASSYAVRDGGEHTFFRGQVRARIEMARPAALAPGVKAGGPRARQ